MMAKQLFLFNIEGVTAPDVQTIESVTAPESVKGVFPDLNPCPQCPLKGLCSDECGAHLYPIDVPAALVDVDFSGLYDYL